MEFIGPWLTQSLDHLKVDWQKHMVPTLVMFAAVMVLVLVLCLFIAVGAVIGIAAGSEDLMALFIMVFSLLGTVVMMVMIAPLQLGYMRGCLKLLRGGTFELSEFGAGLRFTPGAIVMMIIVLSSVMVAMCFCYFPAFIVGALFMFAFPVMADRECGPIEALKTSVEMVKPHLWGVVLYSFLMGMIMGFVSYVPILGAFAVLPIGSTMVLIPYLDLLRRQENATEASGTPPSNAW